MNVNQSNFDQLWQTIQNHHEHHASILSTNTELKNTVIRGEKSHSLLHLMTADHQSLGRGQHGRSWVSSQGAVFYRYMYQCKVKRRILVSINYLV